jgi:hypothetical protein
MDLNTVSNDDLLHLFDCIVILITKWVVVKDKIKSESRWSKASGSYVSTIVDVVFIVYTIGPVLKTLYSCWEHQLSHHRNCIDVSLQGIWDQIKSDLRERGKERERDESWRAVALE